jgi:hypothetical protein
MNVDVEIDQRLSALHAPEELVDEVQKRLRSRGVFFGQNVIPTFIRPHLLEAAVYDALVADTERLFALIDRVISSRSWLSGATPDDDGTT